MAFACAQVKFLTECSYVLRFSESKSEKILYVERIVACFGRKREIFFKVQLCTDAFLRRKAVEKPFAAQTPPRKRGYEEDFARSKTFFSHTAFTKVTALLLRYVHVTYGKIAARQARGYGVLYEVKPFREKCYFSYTQTVNRTYFYDQLAVAR